MLLVKSVVLQGLLILVQVSDPKAKEAWKDMLIVTLMICGNDDDV